MARKPAAEGPCNAERRCASPSLDTREALTRGPRPGRPGRAESLASPARGWFRRCPMRKLAVLLALLAVLAFGAGPVLASSYGLVAQSPTVGKSMVAVTVPVRVTCPAIDPSYTLQGQIITVSVEQAVHKAIAHGTGQVFGNLVTGLVVVCDGTPKTVNVVVLADPSGPPFTRGFMNVGVSAEFYAGIWNGDPNCPGCGSILIDDFPSAAPIDLRIK